MREHPDLSDCLNHKRSIDVSAWTPRHLLSFHGSMPENWIWQSYEAPRPDTLVQRKLAYRRVWLGPVPLRVLSVSMV